MCICRPWLRRPGIRITPCHDRGKFTSAWRRRRIWRAGRGRGKGSRAAGTDDSSLAFATLPCETSADDPLSIRSHMGKRDRAVGGQANLGKTAG
jgi:hypothetical protein